MDNRRLSDGNAGYDISFQVALDERFQRISAVEALKIKDRFPKTVFYCPKCYKIDPNNKTRVIPSSHNPPRFNRYNGEAHLKDCQYKNAIQYLKAISQKIQVKIDGKEIQLSLMPYEGRGIVNQTLGVRIEFYTREDNRKFMELVKEILTDFEMKYFYRKYNSYKVGCGDGKSPSFKKLFASIDNAKASPDPYEEKLNIVVGQVKEVFRNDHYIFLHMDSARSPYELSLYFDRFFYRFDSLSQLEGKRIAGMGYIQKQKDGLYVMEIVSAPHQIAILDDEHIHLSPSVQEKEISSFLEQLMTGLYPIKAEDFYRSYYQEKLEQLQDSVNGEIDTLKELKKQVEKEKMGNRERLMKVEEDMIKVRDDLNKTEHQINTVKGILADLSQKVVSSQLRINQLEKESQGWWNWLRNIIYRRTPKMIRSEIELNKNKMMEYIRQLEQEKKRLNSLEDIFSLLKDKLQMNKEERSFLQDRIKIQDGRCFELDREIEKLQQQIKSAKEQAVREKELKEKYIFHGQLYELMVHPNWSVLIDIQFTHQNLSLECMIGLYLVQKIENFYLPYEHHHKTKYPKSSQQRTIRSNRYHTIEKMTNAIQTKLSEDVLQLCSLIPELGDKNNG